MMNNDCLSQITQFMKPMEAMRISVDFAVKNFPSCITITTVEELAQFERWVNQFDTSNLTTVNCNICCFDWTFPQGIVLGRVPSSVKVLNLSVYNDCRYEISDTVEELRLGLYEKDVALPASLKVLTLGEKFSGTILSWPNNLEELYIQGWESEYGNGIVHLDTLPNTIHTMTLTWGTAVQVDVWPLGLKNLTIETSEDDMLQDWLEIVHAPIPEGVLFNRIIV